MESLETCLGVETVSRRIFNALVLNPDVLVLVLRSDVLVLVLRPNVLVFFLVLRKMSWSTVFK